jgi:hypothetical protein
MPNITKWLVRLAVMVAVPAIPCCGYYSVAAVGTENPWWTLPLIMACPAALIGLIGWAIRRDGEPPH